MKIFRELHVVAPSNQALSWSDLIGRVQAKLDLGWSRDIESEGNWARDYQTKPPFSFRCTKQGRREEARLYLGCSETRMHVFNVVPQSVQRLSIEQYNLIVAEFCERFVRPVAEPQGFRVELSADERQIDEVLPSGAARLLHQFSAAANKGTGSAHPYDKRRWFDFLIEAYKSGASLDSYTLRRWLIEEENWPDELATNLVEEYEFARSLLTQFDQKSANEPGN